MLQRPEIFSREDILLFIGSKNPEEKYDWSNAKICARGQYLASRGITRHHKKYYDLIWSNEFPIRELNNIAHICHNEDKDTFGELHQALQRQWA